MVRRSDQVPVGRLVGGPVTVAGFRPYTEMVPAAALSAAWHSTMTALAPLVEGEAAASEGGRRLTPALVQALIAHRLYRLWIPRTFGGEELTLPESLAIFEATSRMDGSFGWATTIGAGGGLFAAQLEPQFAREVFGPTEALIAGSGTPSGTAMREAGGFSVTGRWRYASGSQCATWFTASCALQDAGGPILDVAGRRTFRAMAFPRDRITVHDTWDALGMRATTSHDFSAEDVFVPAGHSFDVLGTPLESGPLYHFPFNNIAELSFAAVALGAALHGVEEFRRLAAGKRLHYGTDLVQNVPITRHRIANAEVMMGASREGFYAAAANGWSAVSAGAVLDDTGQADITNACILATEAATRSLDLLLPLAGMSPLLPGSTFGRCWRDTHTVAQHALLSPLRRRE